MTPELHLFVLWDRVGSSRETVLHRIRAEFEILRVFRIRWSPSLFSDNLSRFYGQKLPAGCNKEESCGTGPFTLAVIRDTRPHYAMRETTRGTARVNVRTFDLKAFFRSPAGGSLPIHATDTSREAAHDLALLLGVGPSGFESAYPGSWNGEAAVPLRRDVSGAHGWESLGELFAVFNEAVDYVVLRNFECLPERYHLESHGDIDLLVGSYVDACLVANSTPVFDDPCRVHRTVVIGGKAVPFDFRHVGDGYYDERWQRHILESRRLTDGGFFAPDPETHFYSLLYHAAVHKPAVAPDYAERLSGLARSIGISIPGGGFFGDSPRLRSFLLDHMRPRGYRLTRPQDPSVHFNPAVALGPIERIATRILPRRKYAPPTVLKGREQAVPVYDRTDERLIGAARANLLRPFEFGLGQRILELGCEAGALTRHLGEVGAEVVAVESVPGLAALAEERCRDLPNVRVVCDDLLTAMADGRFDVVTLIGTPERVAASDGLDDPLDAFLGRAATSLKPDGLLVLAIDNPLGLKYFNGYPEERTGIPFFGINGLLDRGDPAAVGRRTLRTKLARAGFGAAEFLFPFPDYRLPGLILSGRALDDARLNVADLLISNTGRSRIETHHRAFAEDLAWRVVAGDGLLADLANSFLVLARREGAAPRATDWLAKMYSRGRRHPCYQVEATIAPDEAGGLTVHKRKLFYGAPALGGAWLRHTVADSPYLSGELLIGRIHKAMTREAGIEELAACFAPWLKFLLAHATVNEKGEHVLPENFVDCIPANLIETASGELRYFDAEWVSGEPVPLAWTVVRGILCSLADCLENGAISQMTYRQLVTQISERNDILLREGDFVVADRCEARLVAQYDAAPDQRCRFADLIDGPVQMMSRLATPAADYRQSLAWHKAELARVKNTVSWRITGPLRAAWNLLRRLAQSLR